MANVYREILEAREDMTEWLIHFTRDADGASARDVLLRILAEGALRPGRALRGGRPTIYGPTPAVCFSEQPVGAFLKYLMARAGHPFGPTGYGMLMHKHDAFADGALPVIYGLRGTSEIDLDHQSYIAGARQLAPECIPFEEQYRYVAFAPTREPHPLDWSHEREWRWCPASRGVADSFALGGSGWATGNGMSQGRCHVMVERDADVVWLQERLPAVRAAAAQGDEDSDEVAYRRGRWLRTLRDVNVVSVETTRRALAGNDRRYYRVESWPHEALPSVVPSNTSTNAPRAP